MEASVDALNDHEAQHSKSMDEPLPQGSDVDDDLCNDDGGKSTSSSMGLSTTEQDLVSLLQQEIRGPNANARTDMPELVPEPGNANNTNNTNTSKETEPATSKSRQQQRRDSVSSTESDESTFSIRSYDDQTSNKDMDQVCTFPPPKKKGEMNE